jgi:hypothetical protein
MPQLREVALTSGQVGDTPTIVNVEFDGIPEVVVSEGFAYVLAANTVPPLYRMATLAQPRAKTAAEEKAELREKVRAARSLKQEAKRVELEAARALLILGEEVAPEDAAPAKKVNAVEPEPAPTSPVSVGALRVG